MVVMVACLVLFSAFALIEVGTLDSIHPDLSRIGIHTQPKASTAPLAQVQSSPASQQSETVDSEVSPNMIDTASSEFTVGSDDSDTNEGDNPTYIE